MNNEIDNHQTLLKEFNLLNSIQKKLDFWETKLQRSYITYLQDFDNLDQYRDFHITYTPKDSAEGCKEWKELNDWILTNLKPRETNDHYSYFTLKMFKNKFNQNLKLAKNKAEFINTEIKKVHESFLPFHGIFPKKSLGTGSMVSMTYNANYKAFNDYLEYNLSPDYSKLTPGLHVIRFANGKTLAEYKQFLTASLQKYKSSNTKTAEENNLTHNQLALLFYYTEIINHNIDLTIVSKVFSGLLDINFKNLYDSIRTTPGKDKRENLEVVKSFLENNNIKPPLSLLADIKKLA